MAALEDFLSATDLDDLMRAFSAIETLTDDEAARVEQILCDWRDHQAIANLLFHPQLIAEATRVQVLDRALGSDEVPYFQLAATVGLQGFGGERLPAERRSPWIAALAAFLDSSATVLAERASVVLYDWAVHRGDGQAARALAFRYPAGADGALHNIVAALLLLYASHPPDDLARRLEEWQVPDERRQAILKGHQEYLQLKALDPSAAKNRTYALFAYIPNLSEAERYGLGSVSRHPKKRRWRLW